MRRRILWVAGLLAAAQLAGPAARAQAQCAGRPDRRVDLGTPTFSNPTNIDNPLLPIGSSGQEIQLGDQAGEKLRLEVTSLPDTRIVRWNNRDVKVRVESFVGYADGRIAETALDYYAQDNAGNVWYFGEDVTNYEDGAVADHDGTWLAGRDGPPGMIMPARPRVGDVYRPENIPGLVFEETTVKAVDKTVRGPLGSVKGAILVQECTADGVLENKIFAPGYGELQAMVPAESEITEIAVAVPKDASSGGVPASLRSIGTLAKAIFDSAPAEDWPRLDEIIETLDTDWDRYRRSTETPRLLEEQMDEATDAVETAAEDENAEDLRQASIDLAFAGLDFELRYRSPASVDRDRIRVWQRQLAHDQSTGSPGDVAGDRVVIETIRGRIR